jgi:hypothetical protein
MAVVNSKLALIAARRHIGMLISIIFVYSMNITIHIFFE